LVSHLSIGPVPLQDSIEALSWKVRKRQMG
jgi:hypothetical protein